MDGLPPDLPALLAPARQHTLKAPIGCVGTGLHSGKRVSLTLHPAPAGHGIVFRRTDLGRDVPARFDHVADARLATTLALPQAPEVRVGTVEHLMAALAGMGIDNALVEVDGPELPILDGSAAHFVFLIDCAGTVEQDLPRETIEVCRPVRVADGDGFAELRPTGAAHGRGGFALDMALSIDFAAAAIGRQALALRLTPESFRRELARARTFAPGRGIDRLARRRPRPRRQPGQRGGGRRRPRAEPGRAAHGPANSSATSCWTRSATWRWPDRADRRPLRRPSLWPRAEQCAAARAARRSQRVGAVRRRRTGPGRGLVSCPLPSLPFAAKVRDQRATENNELVCQS